MISGWHFNSITISLQGWRLGRVQEWDGGDDERYNKYGSAKRSLKERRTTKRGEEEKRTGRRAK